MSDFRDLIAHNVAGSDFCPDWDAADGILATRISDDPNAPTIGDLLRWGENVAKAEHDDYTGYTTINGQQVAASGTLLAALRTEDNR